MRDGILRRGDRAVDARNRPIMSMAGLIDKGVIEE
jgi:hypothetical protein